ncbi:hypothetical protein G6F50_014749 [Rhizopus delemar]|uniref:Uncharacterized protein n=1 Tax=Rhizopus delemar TaxID=936053 RepID=A0A9P7C617_9FUNG|nr:hypothetical protein G6F50_014749 [Rhizopus delemar]
MRAAISMPLMKARQALATSKVIAADRGVDQQADLGRGDARVFQRLAPGHGGRIGGQHAVVPQAAGVDAGDVAEHVGADTQAVQRRLQPLVDFLGRQRMRRVDVCQAGDRDILEEHRV